MQHDPVAGRLLEIEFRLLDHGIFLQCLIKNLVERDRVGGRSSNQRKRRKQEQNDGIAGRLRETAFFGWRLTQAPCNRSFFERECPHRWLNFSGGRVIPTAWASPRFFLLAFAFPKSRASGLLAQARASRA